MHNLYVPPIKIFIFLFLLGLTGFGAHAFHRADVPTPSLPTIPTYTYKAEEAEVSLAEKTWSNIVIQTNGADRKYGNIISMQVYLRSSDFAKEEWWAGRIEELLKTGKDANIYDRKTIVIFPEHIGTGLVFLGEKESVFEAKSWKSALDLFALKHEADLTPFLPSDVSKPGAKWEASFRLQAQKMADVYQKTFSALAKQYNVPILAGSILLPGPKVVRGTLVIDPKAPLYNVSVPFAADGRVMDPLVKKTVLTDEEESFVTAGEVSQDRTWIVPGWKVGVFVGHEVFHAALYDRLKGRPLDGLVSPGFSFSKMNRERWKDYIQDPEFMSLSDEDVWIKHGLPKHIKTTRAVESVQVFLQGDFFGETASGKTFNIRDFVNQDESGSSKEPRILNLYF
ncbi:hydrolase, carbon-nitrogen family protein [Leptospira idonii]|uniref:Hydrolase, carbon-nitrogen family protein n=1 Tax=Leptospira idonii TaxID=1193500 RepID=A0A4R9LVR1_9LEPT|nr:hydrolase, carbon-nitrogen family protein [Leptospira idonii]TGN17103.1 hydrolase, carbon-nitrogen family protein [Leptospira idonii]